MHRSLGRRSLGAIVALSSALLATACGSGSSSTSTPAATAQATQFPYDLARANLVNQGFSADCTFSGQLAGQTVNGSGRYALSTPTGATFEGQAGLVRTFTKTGTIAPSNAAPTGSPTLIYTTSNYEPLGEEPPGEYRVVSASSVPPTKVAVGDSLGTVTMLRYGNSGKLINIGRVDSIGVVEADSSSSAVLKYVSSVYAIPEFLVQTETLRIRVDTSGAVRFLSHSVAVTNRTNDVVTCTAK